MSDVQAGVRDLYAEIQVPTLIAKEQEKQRQHKLRSEQIIQRNAVKIKCIPKFNDKDMLAWMKHDS